MGINLTESEFDTVNARITQACNADGITCDAYADKSCPVEGGYWMQIVEGFEKYFTAQEIASAIPYVRIEEEVIVI